MRELVPIRRVVKVPAVIKWNPSNGNIVIPEAQSHQYSHQTTGALSRYRPVVDMLISLPIPLKA